MPAGGTFDPTLSHWIWKLLNYPCILMTVFAAGHWDLNPFSTQRWVSVYLLKRGIFFLCRYIFNFEIVRKRHICMLSIKKKCAVNLFCARVCEREREYVCTRAWGAVGERDANWHFFRDSLAICYSTVAPGVCGGSW